MNNEGSNDNVISNNDIDGEQNDRCIFATNSVQA